MLLLFHGMMKLYSRWKLNVGLCKCAEVCKALSAWHPPTAGVDIHFFTRMAQEIAQAEGVDLEELKCLCPTLFGTSWNRFEGQFSGGPIPFSWLGRSFQETAWVCV